jgi:hypothetical protein
MGLHNLLQDSFTFLFYLYHYICYLFVSYVFYLLGLILLHKPGLLVNLEDIPPPPNYSGVATVHYTSLVSILYTDNFTTP